MTTDQIARDFFDGYARALLDRDVAAVAAHYAVPALILFPGQSVPVSDATQTEQFFEGAFAQYADVTAAEVAVDVAARAPHSLWVDATWTYDTGAGERNMYQLVETGVGWRIAVLTPLEG